jgi:hypothetical protein
MCVNTSKTKFIIFHTKGKRLDLQDSNLVFNNNEIGRTPDPNLVTPIERICNSNVNPSSRTYKLLGVYLDEHLSFDHHVRHICNKLSKSLFYLNRAKSFVDKQSLKMLCYSLVHSNLLYCIGTTSAMTQTNFKKIKLLQKKAIRISPIQPSLSKELSLSLALTCIPPPGLPGGAILCIFVYG